MKRAAWHAKGETSHQLIADRRTPSLESSRNAKKIIGCLRHNSGSEQNPTGCSDIASARSTPTTCTRYVVPVLVLTSQEEGVLSRSAKVSIRTRRCSGHARRPSRTQLFTCSAAAKPRHPQPRPPRRPTSVTFLNLTQASGVCSTPQLESGPFLLGLRSPKETGLCPCAARRSPDPDQRPSPATAPRRSRR